MKANHKMMMAALAGISSFRAALSGQLYRAAPPWHRDTVRVRGRHRKHPDGSTYLIKARDGAGTKGGASR